MNNQVKSLVCFFLGLHSMGFVGGYLAPKVLCARGCTVGHYWSLGHHLLTVWWIRLVHAGKCTSPLSEAVFVVQLSTFL